VNGKAHQSKKCKENINVEIVSAEFQMKMINLTFDTDLRNSYQHVGLFDLYRLSLHADKFPVPSAHAWRMTNIFGSMGVCKRFFSKMSVVKCRSRNRLAMKDWKAMFKLLLVTNIQIFRICWQRNNGEFFIDVLPSFKIKLCKTLLKNGL
jgi:hypothetical protein